MSVIEQFQERKTARREALEGPVRELVVERVLPALGTRSREFELRVPRWGLNSLVYLVDVKHGPNFALRVGYGFGDAREFAKRRRATRFWTRRSLPTPASLRAGVWPWQRSQDGLYWLAEAQVRGRNVVECDVESGAYEALGKALARVHQVTRPLHHGALFRPKLGAYATHFVHRNRGRIAGVGWRHPQAADAERRLSRWLVRAEPELRKQRRFHLIHRRCTESDLMFDDQGHVQLLEPHRSGFGPFAVDAVRTEVRVCGDDEEKVKRFHEAYFAALPTQYAQDFEQLGPIFRIEFHLANAARWAGKLRRGKAHVEELWTREFERLRELISVY